MDVKIPSFDLKISKLWAVIVIVWSIFLVLITYYVNSKIAEYKIQHSIERTSEAVSSLGTAFHDRKPIVDQQLSALRTDVTQLQKDVAIVVAKQDDAVKNQVIISNQVSDVQRSVNNLTAALLQKERTASQPAYSSPAVYEVTP